jgi:radical SAM protein with 4Fe4S-binding SPASM domain
MSSDQYSIDSHKLMYHPRRVSQWLDANNEWSKIKEIYPLYVEISPMGACNHRCTFCSVDYLSHDTGKQKIDVLKERIKEMKKLGVKSIMFAGEGEPSLWKPLPGLLDICGQIGIDTSMTTNMVPFTDKNTESFVKNCSWIKASINAGTDKDYAQIHQTKKEDFKKVLRNFEKCVAIKKQQQYKCVLGGQMLLLPENKDSAVSLARELRDIGADYLVIKPYTQNKHGISREHEGLQYNDTLELEKLLKNFETDTFKVVFRAHAMNKLKDEKLPYKTCYSTPNFWAYIMADGGVYTCQTFAGDERFCVGNINEQSFKDIWESDKRKSQLNFMLNELDISECRKNCRMDEVNRYLWSLKNPDPHVNFI